MRSSHDVSAEILKVQGKVGSISEAIAEKEKLLAKAKMQHANLLEKDHTGDHKSISKHRQTISDLTLELEGLSQAKGNLESKLARAEKELELAALYEDSAKAYKEAEPAFMERAEGVRQAVVELNEKVQAFNSITSDFLEKAGSPVLHLQGLLQHPAMNGLSMRRFIEGEVAEARVGENEGFIQEVASQYRQLALSLPRPESAEKSWRAFSDRLEFVHMQARGLVPRGAKYIPGPERARQPGPQQQRNVKIPVRRLIQARARGTPVLF